MFLQHAHSQYSGTSGHLGPSIFPGCPLSSFGMSIIRGFTVAKQFYTLRLRLESSRGKILMDEVQT